MAGEEDKMMEAKKLDTPLTYGAYQRDKIKELREEIRLWQELAISGWFMALVMVGAFYCALH